MKIPKYNREKCSNNLFKGYSGCHCNYCHQYSLLNGKWIVYIHGGSDKSSEVSVVRENNRHGQKSWGWYGDSKILIYESRNATILSVWIAVLYAAKKVAREKNREESLTK